MVTNAIPKDIVGEPHADGEIWSAALWEIFEAIGRDASIRLVVESHFFLSPDAELVDGASAIFMADQELNGGVNFDFILGIMENRGFFTPPKLASDAFEETIQRRPQPRSSSRMSTKNYQSMKPTMMITINSIWTRQCRLGWGLIFNRSTGS